MTDRAINLNEPSRASSRVRLPSTHPGMQHLTGIWAGGEERVIAQHFRVPIPGIALFLFPYTSQIVESTSITSLRLPRRAPAAHARRNDSAIPLSS